MSPNGSSTSWFNHARKWIAIVLPLALTGCFEPVYAPSSGKDMRAELAAIAINPVSDRIGHYLVNELSFAFNGTGSDVPPKYRLTITVQERVGTPLVDTISGQATAGTVIVDADYKLVPVGSETPLTSGTAFMAASYDRSSDRFANIRAARDAEIRDAKTLADQIRIRIIAALGTKS